MFNLGGYFSTLVIGFPPIYSGLWSMAVMHIAKANAIHLEFKIKEKEKKSMVVSRSIVEAIGFLTGPLGCPI